MAADYPQASLVADDETTSSKDSVFDLVDQMPEFPGGQAALLKFLTDNVRYPVNAQENKIEGKVFCQFIVEKDGHIGNVVVIRSTGDEELDAEAIRLVESMPQWKPARYKGKPVRVKYTIPVQFRLSSDEQKNTKDEEKLSNGDMIYLVQDDSYSPIIGVHNEIIGPNYGYARVTPTMFQSYTNGLVRIKDDTMRIKFFKDSRLEKTELYYAKDYITSGGDVYLTGSQLYYLNNQIVCDEYIRNGQLKAIKWFSPNGDMDRRYIFNNNQLVMLLYFYPSGKVKMKETYTSATQYKREAFMETGEPGEWEDAYYPEGLDKLEEYFNRHFHSSVSFEKADFYITAFIDSLGRSSLLIHNPSEHYMDLWKEIDNLRWIPAKINGNPVSSVQYFTISYTPTRYLREGDTVQIMMPQKKSRGFFRAVNDNDKRRYNGLQWRENQKWIITSSDTCSCYAVCHFLGDTLELEGYRKQTNMLFMRQQSLIDTSTNTLTKIGYTHWYEDQKLVRSDYYDGTTFNQVVWYDENQHPKYSINLRRNNKSTTGVLQRQRFFPYGEIKEDNYLYEEFYPSGGVRYQEAYDLSKDKTKKQYFNRQGVKAKATQPSYPTGEKNIGVFLSSKLSSLTAQDLQNWFLWAGWESEEISISGEGYVYFVIDECGRVIDVDLAIKLSSYKILTSINDGYSQLLAHIKKCLMEDPTIWTPGTIDGKPETMRTKVTVKFSFDARR